MRKSNTFLFKLMFLLVVLTSFSYDAVTQPLNELRTKYNCDEIWYNPDYPDYFVLVFAGNNYSSTPSYTILKKPFTDEQKKIENIEEYVYNRFKDIRGFIDFPIKIKGKWIMINSKLDILIEPEYDHIQKAFTDSTYWTYKDKAGDDYKGSGLIGLTDTGTVRILSPIYKHIHHLEKNLFIVSKKINEVEKYGLVNADSIVVPLEFTNYQFSNSGFDGFIRFAKWDGKDTLWGLYLLNDDKLHEQLPPKYTKVNYKYGECDNNNYYFLVMVEQMKNGELYTGLYAKKCNDVTTREILPPLKCDKIDLFLYNDIYQGKIFFEDGRRQPFKLTNRDYILQTGKKITPQIKNELLKFWKKLKKAIINVDKKRFSEMTVYTDQAEKNNFINGFYEIFPAWIRSVLKEQSETDDMFEFEAGMNGFRAYYRTNLSYDTYRFVFLYNSDTKKWLLQEVKIFD